MNSTFRLLKKRFKILKGWRVVVKKDKKWAGQTCINRTKRMATVFDWNEGDRPHDFELHEILHVVFASLLLMDKRKQKELFRAEEQLIQDICSLLLPPHKAGKSTWRC